MVPDSLAQLMFTFSADYEFSLAPATWLGQHIQNGQDRFGQTSGNFSGIRVLDVRLLSDSSDPIQLPCDGVQRAQE